MPRVPKSPNGVTGPVKPRRASTRKPGGNGSVSEDQVAKRAYEIFESRGGRHGADLDDWLEAERQLKQSMVSAERRKAAAV
jgi:Protein of unknown function (DUF2934)